jgi:hypothetical protein
MRLHRSDRRGGATTVEFAFIAILLFMLLFGIFEYGRFLFIHHLASNAAREGVRFAVVHTGGGSTVIMPNGKVISEPVTITEDNIKEVVTKGSTFTPAINYGKGMCGMEGNIIGYNVEAYAIPNADLFATPPRIDSAGKPSWDSAGFNQKVAVQITGSYRPVLPSLLHMKSAIPFKVTALYGSEAN